MMRKNNRREAENQKAKALDQAEALRRRVYVADMTAAREAWQIGDVDTALAILRGQIPTKVKRTCGIRMALLE